MSQESQNSTLISVFLDCRGCDSGFIRSEIEFINFVRDQSDSEIHLVVTRATTGSGGRQYTINFIGQGMLESLSNEVIYTSFDSDTEEEERNGLVQYIKLGIIPFLTEKDQLDNFEVTFSGENTSALATPEKDPWNNWIFELGANTFFSGEENENELNVNGRVRISRTTEKWRVRFNYFQNYNREVFKSTDDSTNVTTEDIFTTGRQNLFGVVGYSLSDHWSVGSYFSGGASTRDNIDIRYGFTPVIEYSFYPYSDFARREVTLRYGVFPSYYNYTEETIYGKTSEFLVRHDLNFNMEYTKPWGGIEGRINGRSYTHDLSKNRLLFDFEIDMRVVRGLSFFVSLNYSIINDQLSLSADGVTDKEAIANTRQQATSFDYGGAIGFEITFGSIYNNIVNTRL